uniref:Family with sequence similarity 185 member A n=1 Tax=Salvator merianae TaxID=96440 RepID=A0A8D0CBX1_SALMN
MLPLLFLRWWHAAEKTAGNWHRLLNCGGFPGRASWASKCQQVSSFMTSPCGHSRSHGEPEERKPKNSKLQWTLFVSPFGLLRAQLPCHITVRPLDPHKYPDADRVLVSVSGMDTSSPLDSLHVKYDEELKAVTIVSDDMDGATSVDVRTPMKFDLDITTSGSGCVKAEKIECDTCRIETKKGNSILQSIKSKKIDIYAKGGKVTCLGTLQGNTDIHVSEESIVNIEKLQGSCVNISTESGLLKAEYLYAESSFLSSAAGNISLGNVHGDTTLHTKTGNITVDSSEGFLKISTHQGKIEVYIINQAGEVDLKSQKGSITVKVPATLKAYLQLSGRKVEVSPEIQLLDTQNVSGEDWITVTGYLNEKVEEEKYIKAEAQHGKIILKSQTWFQSVKLKTP